MYNVWILPNLCHGFVLCQCIELPVLFTAMYSKHFKLISKVKNPMLLEDASKRFPSSLLIGQKYNFGYDGEILNLFCWNGQSLFLSKILSCRTKGVCSRNWRVFVTTFVNELSYEKELWATCLFYQNLFYQTLVHCFQLWYTVYWIFFNKM